MLQRPGIEDAPTTARNPQANSVCERIVADPLSVMDILKESKSKEKNESEGNHLTKQKDKNRWLKVVPGTKSEKSTFYYRALSSRGIIADVKIFLAS